MTNQLPRGLVCAMLVSIMKRSMLAGVGVLCYIVIVSVRAADLPGAPGEMVDFPTAWTADAPGVADASFLLHKPAGALGPVTVRGGHFYTGDRRLRFWGVN